MTTLSLRRLGSSGKGPRRANPRHTVLVGVAMILVGTLGFYYAITHKLPFQGQSGRLITAYFTEANQLQPGNTPVRVDGIDVGKVDSITPINGGRDGRVVLRITNPSVSLHSDAHASVQFRTLLGANFVVQLNPGSASAPDLANDTIPLRHTTVQVEFDDILRVFNQHTGFATRVDLKQLATSMAGTQARTLITAAAPTLAPVPAAFNALRGVDTNDLSGLVASASQTVKTLSADRADLQGFITGGAATLSAVSVERPALASALQKAPSALGATVAVSHSVELTLPPLDRLISTLGPGARALGPAAAATLPTARQLRVTLNRARPLLREVSPAINSLSAAANPGDAVLTGLAPTLGRLNSNILPWLYSTDSELKRPVYQLIGPTFAGFASVAAEYDTHSHIIHFPAQPELNSVDLLPCTVNAQALTPSQLVQCSSVNSVLQELLGGTTLPGSSLLTANRASAGRAR